MRKGCSVEVDVNLLIKNMTEEAEDDKGIKDELLTSL